MRMIIFALLLAISYAQTDGAGAGQGMGGMGSMMQGMGMPGNFMQYAMLDQMDVIDGGDMLEDMAKGMFGMDLEDLFDMGMMFASQYMNGQGGSQGMPDLGGLVSGLMGGQGAQGMGSMGGMGSMMPYMYMDGGDMFDGMEDMYKYGMGMPMMGGMGMGGQQQQASRRLRMPRHNRLLSKPHMKKRMLRRPREMYLPFLMGMMNQAQQNPQGTAQSAVSSMLPFFGYDGMDSEDRAAALMMGANPNSLPPPVDGIDGEDLWMYANTRYDPRNMFKRGTSSSTGSSTDASSSGSSGSTTGTTTQSQFPWWFFNSRLQRQRPMKY